MNPILKNILGLVIGMVFGGMVNGLIVKYGSPMIPPPAGVDPNDLESIKSNMHLYEFKHFIVPYLAHILGSFIAGMIAAQISNSKIISLIAGGIFIIGGAMVIYMIPETPVWFSLVDLASYIPAAYLGYLVGRRKSA